MKVEYRHVRSIKKHRRDTGNVFRFIVILAILLAIVFAFCIYVQVTNALQVTLPPSRPPATIYPDALKPAAAVYRDDYYYYYYYHQLEHSPRTALEHQILLGKEFSNTLNAYRICFVIIIFLYLYVNRFFGYLNRFAFPFRI